LNLTERPTYNPSAVEPMRRQLTDVGFKELLTVEDVERAIAGAENLSGSMLLVINSVCGCAAGNARPGVAAALQGPVIPDRLYTVFAGMEKAAVARVREYLAPHPPSSPSMAIYLNGSLAEMIHRRDIENSSAEQLRDRLAELFGRYCTAPGPSIPPEQYAALEMEKFCGSTLERFEA